MALSDIEFSDIYLGKTKRYLAGVKGGVNPLPAPDSIKEDLDSLWRECEEANLNSHNRETTVSWNEMFFRISLLQGLGEKTYVVRAMPKSVPNLDDLGIHPAIKKRVLQTNISGLIVIAGEFASGKTTTASAIVKERLSLYGGVAITIEDPPEMPLEGTHNNGICYQTTVDENEGETFSFLTKMAARWAPDIIFLSEIRTAETAVEALKVALAGRLVICTLHAANVVASIERLHALANTSHDQQGEISSLLASGLCSVVHQSLEKDPSPHRSNLTTEFLFLNEEGAKGARSMIKARRFGQLGTEITLQLNKVLGEK